MNDKNKASIEVKLSVLSIFLMLPIFYFEIIYVLNHFDTLFSIFIGTKESLSSNSSIFLNLFIVINIAFLWVPAITYMIAYKIFFKTIYEIFIVRNNIKISLQLLGSRVFNLIKNILSSLFGYFYALLVISLIVPDKYVAPIDRFIFIIITMDAVRIVMVGLIFKQQKNSLSQ